MQLLWTWRGKSFGYRDKDNLLTYSGKHVGTFHESEIYNAQGKYLGEMMNDRLITDTRKKNFSQISVCPICR